MQLLRLRAQMLSEIRSFFANKGILEVETPLLCHGIGTDPNLNFFKFESTASFHSEAFFLQTSPEFSMKRLLAAGSGSIFQICKAFRQGELGGVHNPEFTMLEWYRVGFNLQQLMAETAELLYFLLNGYLPLKDTQFIPYASVFKEYTSVDPLQFKRMEYVQCARANQLIDAEQLCGENHSMWLDFLFSYLVQPALSKHSLYMIYDYPACLASLARLKADNPLLSERVEVFINGIELGNGFHELCDAKEQQHRFESEIIARKRNGLPMVVKDDRFLAALASGLPDCSGMAIGLDRVLMLMAGYSDIQQVLAFPINNA
jgi:elongation factor P--(R)-beta-lysine ligase